MPANQAATDLAESIADLIDTYVTGHDLSYAEVIGILHMVAWDLNKQAVEDDEDDEEPSESET